MSNPERRTFPGYELLMLDTESDVQVWLDTELADLDGICLARAPTRAEAVKGALHTLYDAIDAMCQMPTQESR